MDLQENFDALKERALAEGITLFGVADVRPVREQFLIPGNAGRSLPFGVSLGLRLSRSILSTVESAPNQIYYFHYQRANILLDQTALKLTNWIQERGFEAFPVPASQVVDWERQLGTVSHREIAYRAGLGWYGRNNLLVHPRYGSQVRLASVLTDFPLTVGEPLDNGCGECRACRAVCPAQAIGETTFDREACHRKLREFTKIQKIGQMICGVCQKACPGTNNRDQRGRE